MDWNINYVTLEDWDDVYQNLMVKNEKETIMDFHPIQSLPDDDGRYVVIVDIDFIIGREYDLYKYKEACNEMGDIAADPYCSYGMFTAIQFIQKHRRVYINYIDYERAEEG